MAVVKMVYLITVSICHDLIWLWTLFWDFDLLLERLNLLNSQNNRVAVLSNYFVLIAHLTPLQIMQCLKLNKLFWVLLLVFAVTGFAFQWT